MTTKSKPDVSAADIARKLGVNPREARKALRAAGFKAPYSAKDVAKMTAIIRGDKPKPATAKGKRRSETRVDYPSD
jgi:hypothetical protein